MKKFEGYMLVSDFDGTLINRQGEISKENIEAIEYFIREGGLFCGATGRTNLNVLPYKALLPVHSPWILFNGAGIYDFDADAFLYEATIDQKDLIGVANKVMAAIPHINTQVCTGKMLYMVNPNGTEDEMVQKEGQLHEKTDMASIEEPWIKLMFQGAADDLIAVEGLLDQALDLETYRYFYSGTTYLEVMAKQVSKGSGLHVLRELMGDKVTKFFAIGDYYNDVEMLREADVSATPENAPKDIQACATVIVNHHDNHAVKDFIDWIERHS